MSSYDYEPKPLHWRRFGVFTMLPTQYAQPALDWLWERHHPGMKKAMIVTHGGVLPTEQEGVSQLVLQMEYAARGANKTDFRRKVSQAVTKVAGTPNVVHRVHAEQMAFVNLEFREWAKNDPQWLEDKLFAARAVADEMAGRDDWPDDDEEDDQDL